MFRKTIQSALLFLFMGGGTLSAQQPNTISGIITLDSCVVHDVRSGFSLDDFIRFVSADTTFYTAFHDLRSIPYHSSAILRMFDKDHLAQAMYSNRAIQHIDNRARSMEFLFEVHTGDFFDKHGELNYYTAKLFSYIFFQRDTIALTSGTVKQSKEVSALEKRKDQLKVLLFSPGTPVEGIPFMKDKLEIFSPEMAAYYNYSLDLKKWKTGVECYVFRITKKPDVQEGKDVVIDELTTWFDKKDMHIVSRQYHLSCYNMLYDFNVFMDVDLGMVEGVQVPVKILYNGFWDVPGKKPEYGSVQIYIW
ncbi:MAG: hypothetical protein R2794_02960 [Chitinophagales bacterium]